MKGAVVHIQYSLCRLRNFSERISGHHFKENFIHHFRIAYPVSSLFVSVKIWANWHHFFFFSVNRTKIVLIIHFGRSHKDNFVALITGAIRVFFATLSRFVTNYFVFHLFDQLKKKKKKNREKSMKLKNFTI